MNSELKFNTIAFGPVADSRVAGIKNKLIEAIVYGEGRKLLRNPRYVVGNDPPTADIQDRVVWQMKVVKSSDDDGKPPEEVHFRVTETAVEIVEWPATYVVLAVKFDGQKRQIQLVNGSRENVYNLVIPRLAKTAGMRGLANQVIADLIVNGRTHSYLNGGTGKRSRGRSNRNRYDRGRRERHARYPV